MVNSDFIFMDLHSFRSESDVSGTVVSPATGVEVTDSVALHLKSSVGVAAENEVGLLGFGMAQGAFGDLWGETQPRTIEAVEPSTERLAAGVEPLQKQINRRAQLAYERVVDHETIELMSVDGEAPAAVEIPEVLPIDAHADEVRHDGRESLVVIAFDPNDFHSALGIGEFANVGEEAPMVFFEAAEIEVAEDVAQQN